MKGFVPNRSFVTEMNRTVGVQRTLLEAGETVKDNAARIAPVRSGRYRDELTVDQDVTSVAVGSKVFYAHILEWGSVNTPPHAVMQRAARAAGLRFTSE